VPGISFSDWTDGDPEELRPVDLPGQAAVDDGCRDGEGDF
jgi:hypothetical protein